MSIQIGTDIGRYHILEQLGEGGMAVVYKAYDKELEREVALKVIRTDLKDNDRSLKRFKQEANALTKLTHPNIVNLIDFDVYDGNPYIVMEYIPAGNLKQQLSTPIPARQAAALLAPIADALAYAHAQGILHRDVKPSNILITESGQPMLSDFGVAKVLETEETLDLTATGMGVGTPEYMAPEQFTTHDYDQRADIYALGVVMYEMVVGRKPFTADTPYAVAIKQSKDPLPRPSEYVEDVPESVERFLFKALAKDPAHRFTNMGEMLTVLVQVAAGTPVGKELLPEVQPERESSRKRRWGLIGVIGLVTVAAILFGLRDILFSKITGDNEQQAVSSTAMNASTNTPNPTATIALPVGVGTPIPEMLTPITIENFSGIEMIADYSELGEFEGKLTCSHDGNTCTTLSASDIVAIIDMRQPAIIDTFEINKNVNLIDFSFSLDDRYLAVGSVIEQDNMTPTSSGFSKYYTNSYVTIYNLENKTIEFEIYLPPTVYGLYNSFNIAFLPDGESLAVLKPAAIRIYTVGTWEQVEKYDTKINENEFVSLCAPDEGGFFAVADYKSFGTGSHNHTLKIYNIDSGNIINRFERYWRDQTTNEYSFYSGKLQCSRNGKYIAIATEENESVFVIDQRSNSIKGEYTVDGDQIGYFSFSDDGKLLFIMHGSNLLDTWDIESGGKNSMEGWKGELSLEKDNLTVLKFTDAAAIAYTGNFGSTFNGLYWNVGPLSMWGIIE